MSVSEADLERIKNQRRFDARTMEIARSLFIHNQQPMKLAATHGVLPQRIYAIRKAVLELALPPGQVELTLTGPAEAIEAARIAFKKQMAKMGLESAD